MMLFSFFEDESEGAYKNDNYDNTPIVVNEVSYDFNELQSRVNSIKSKLTLIINDLTEEEKLILDLPLIEWKLGFKYGAVTVIHWLEGTGESLEFPYDFFLSADYTNGVDVKNITERFTEDTKYFASSINTTSSNPDGEQLYLYNTSINAISNAYNKAKNSIQSIGRFGYNVEKGTDLSSVVVSENLVESLSVGKPFGSFDDVGAALGRFSQKIYVRGDVFIGDDNVYKLRINDFESRFTDVFTFSDNGIWEEYVRSQDLGCWSKDWENASAFKMNPTLGVTDAWVCIQNSDFTKLQQKAAVKGIELGKEFFIYSEVKIINAEELGKNIVVY